MLRIENNKIIFHYDAEELWIEGWGESGLRVRATKNAQMPDENWVLDPSDRTDAETGQTKGRGSVTEKQNSLSQTAERLLSMTKAGISSWKSIGETAVM